MTLRMYHPDLIQGTEEWLQARCGIVTASVVGKLLTPTLKVANNDTSRGLVLTLAAERITGHVDPMHVSADILRGSEEEPYARDAYAEHYAPVEEMGFMTREVDGLTIGYSPDGLVGDDGLIEIKSRRAKNHMQVVIDGEVPAQHLAQIQCGLLVSGRNWCDYVDFSNGMHLWKRRVYVYPAWQDAIVTAVDAFEANVREVIERYEEAVEGYPRTERIKNLEEMRIA